MMSRIWKQVLMLVVLTIPAAQAADIEVEPGDGTLAVAIAAASSGDTLILRTGQYSGTTVVDRSLVIRAATRLDEPYISGSFTVDGDGVEVTLQGLQRQPSAHPGRRCAHPGERIPWRGGYRRDSLQCCRQQAVGHW